MATSDEAMPLANPCRRCHSEEGLMFHSNGAGGCYVLCVDCSINGPTGHNELKAVSLWNISNPKQEEPVITTTPGAEMDWIVMPSRVTVALPLYSEKEEKLRGMVLNGDAIDTDDDGNVRVLLGTKVQMIIAPDEFRFVVLGDWMTEPRVFTAGDCEDVTEMYGAQQREEQLRPEGE